MKATVDVLLLLMSPVLYKRSGFKILKLNNRQYGLSVSREIYIYIYIYIYNLVISRIYKYIQMSHKQQDKYCTPATTIDILQIDILKGKVQFTKV